MITVPKNPIAAQSKANPPPPEYLLMAQAVQAQQRMNVDHEEPITKNIGSNFEGLYKQLENNKDKVKPGNLLRLHDEKGNEFHYERDDNYEHGFGLRILPRETS